MSEQDSEAFKFGARIGEKLASARTSPAQPAVAARQLIDSILNAHPSVKLPEITGDDDVKGWLTQHKVSEGQLRTALTKARQGLRRASAIREAAAPARKPRKKASAPSVATPDEPKPLATAPIPNRSIDEL